MWKGNKKPKRQERRDNPLLNMMGVVNDGDDDGDLSQFEADLAALMGGEVPKDTSNKNPKKELVEWDVLNKEIEKSLADVEVNEVNSDEEDDLMGELQDLVEEDEPTVKLPPKQEPVKTTAQSSSTSLPPQSSPQPPSQSLDVAAFLQARKEMYQTGISQSTMAAKTRRLQRQLKIIEDMIKKVKRGANIDQNKIPPEIFIKKEAGNEDQTVESQTSTSKAQVVGNQEKNVMATVPNVQQNEPKPSTTSDLQTEKAASSKLSSEYLRILEEKVSLYKAAALKAKSENDKMLAVTYFQAFKKIESAIQEQVQIDLNSLPPITKSSPPKETKPVSEEVPSQQAPVVQNNAVSTPAAAVPSESEPKTVLEHLEARIKFFVNAAEEAAKSGNSGKSRRMGRIVKQYQQAVKSTKAGKTVNYDGLPTPPNFPPIPGSSVPSEENILEKAAQLANTDVVAEANDPPQKNLAPSNKTTPSASVTSDNQAASPSKTKYQAQIQFLEDRQKLFKQAAKQALSKGDREKAKELLRKSKGFDQMIENAKGGIRIDISKCPQPPIMSSNKELIKKNDEVKFEKIEAKDDKELFSRIINILTEQIKQARHNSQVMASVCDVTSAQMNDELAVMSQQDLDYVISCKLHHDPPPRFYYEEKKLKSVEMNSDIAENEMIFTIVKCMGVGPIVKDNKTFVEYEMPFPHDDPIKGHTEESKPSPNPEFNQTFRFPFKRSQRSNQRAVKSKSIKLCFMAKGGFMRSDKTLATCQLKLAPLDTMCSLKSMEKLKDGRKEVGEIELEVKLRTPITPSPPKTKSHKWLKVEQRAPAAKVSKPPVASRNPKTARKAPSSGVPSTSARKDDRVNISSIEASLIDFKIRMAQLDRCKQNNRPLPNDVVSEAKRIRSNIELTKNYLKTGGRNAAKEYYNCLSVQLKFLAHQVQQYEKNSQTSQAKIARKKIEVVRKEMEKYK